MIAPVGDSAPERCTFFSLHLSQNEQAGLFGALCSDNLEVFYYDFYNKSFAHWNDI